MKVRTITMAEVKAYGCKVCGGVPQFHVTDRDDEGLTGSRYLCAHHFTEFTKQVATPTFECDWCNAKVLKLLETERYMDPVPGRIFKVCPSCYQQNQAIIEEAMEDDFDEEEDNVEDDPNEMQEEDPDL